MIPRSRARAKTPRASPGSACTLPTRCLRRSPRPQLAADVDDAGGVDDVVGRVEDSAFMQQLAVAILVEELVVRGSRDDSAAEARDRVVVEDAAEGARGEDVALDAVDSVGDDCLDPELGCARARCARVDVGDEEGARPLRRAAPRARSPRCRVPARRRSGRRRRCCPTPRATPRPPRGSSRAQLPPAGCLRLPPRP